MPAAPDDRVLGDRYMLGRRLGRGGMAEVYEAQDARLARTVAVKSLRTDLAGDHTYQARFRREAQSAASLNHPEIVAVYDTGEDFVDGLSLPYIVMELVTGATLRELLRSGRLLRPERALEMVAAVLRALQYSHDNGIVHRDIKPANVMLSDSGRVKVMDFGIARTMGEETVTLTATASVIGTAAYFSPEQAQGLPVDARSDVYATGCLLFELLAGRTPFVGDSPVTVAYQHVQDQPRPPSEFDPEITAAMDAVVLRALAKNPADRFQSADEMRAAIEYVLYGEQTPGQAMAMAMGGFVTGPAATAVLPQSYDAEPQTAPVERVADVTAPQAPVTLGAVSLGGDAEEQAVASRPPKKRRRGLRAAAITMLTLCLLGGATAVSSAVIGSRGAVPDLVGDTWAQAQSDAGAAGFTVVKGKSTTCSPDTAATGEVCSQSPDQGGKAKKDSPITVSLSSGPTLVDVPDVTGETQQQATSDLKDAGFKVKTTTESTSSVTAGTVVSQSPSHGDGQAGKGSTVTITVARAPRKVSVPDVTGETQQQATSDLQSAGFTVKTSTRQASDPDQVGRVVSQTPSGGRRAGEGSTVTITVGTAGKVAVPPVTGMTLQKAASTLAAAGLDYTVSSGSQDSGATVTAVDPGAGTKVSVGSSVTLTTSGGTTSNATPDASGTPTDDSGDNSGDDANPSDTPTDDTGGDSADSGGNSGDDGSANDDASNATDTTDTSKDASTNEP
ncbi:Stk1 family PASTA domain-containing Ser/Thr kinase [Streptomyces fractus]|uniref:Stk1 family PASTA domain-containing Ser/Thr kinase n=1 Tax=Streptomyces fractus TaxID=641806 RepID=UPI003CF9EBFD